MASPPRTGPSVLDLHLVEVLHAVLLGPEPVEQIHHAADLLHRNRLHAAASHLVDIIADVDDVDLCRKGEFKLIL